MRVGVDVRDFDSDVDTNDGGIEFDQRILGNFGEDFGAQANPRSVDALVIGPDADSPDGEERRDARRHDHALNFEGLLGSSGEGNRCASGNRLRAEVEGIDASFPAHLLKLAIRRDGHHRLIQRAHSATGKAIGANLVGIGGRNRHERRNRLHERTGLIVAHHSAGAHAANQSLTGILKLIPIHGFVSFCVAGLVPKRG